MLVVGCCVLVLVKFTVLVDLAVEVVEMEDDIDVEPLLLDVVRVLDKLDATIEETIELLEVVVKVLEVRDSVVVELEVVLEDAFETGNWYKLRPFGPPQICPALPPHVIEQRPSVALTEPPINELPQ